MSADNGLGYELILGDCMEVMATLEAGSIDCIVTDPPYLTDDAQVHVGGRNIAPIINHTHSIGLPWGYSLDWIDVAARLEPKHWVVYCNYRMLGGLITKLEQYAKLGCVFTWLQRNRPPMSRNVPHLDCEYVVWAKHPKATNARVREFKSMVIDANMPQAGLMATERLLLNGTYKAAHPTQKPVAVVWPFVQRLTDPGQTVLDCFAGSGTTGEVCIKENRNFIGVEIDPAYHAIATKRLANAAAQPLLLQVHP